MVTPVVVEFRSQRARTQCQGPNKKSVRFAEYVPYRRRSASGGIRVATGLIGREVPDRVKSRDVV